MKVNRLGIWSQLLWQGGLMVEEWYMIILVNFLRMRSKRIWFISQIWRFEVLGKMNKDKVFNNKNKDNMMNKRKEEVTALY